MQIVPDESSLLGNLKEQAMSLTGNHSRICKFNGITDANWLRVGPQLEKYYSRAAAPTEPDEPPPSVDPALQGINPSFHLSSLLKAY